MPSDKCPICGGVVRYIPVQVTVGDCYEYKKQLQCVGCEFVGEIVNLDKEDYKIWGAGEE